jgi:hypothetical protein
MGGMQCNVELYLSPCFISLTLCFVLCAGVAFQPEFSEPISNLTVPVGRDATFQCMVLHLGGYRVRSIALRTSYCSFTCSRNFPLDSSYSRILKI